MDFETILFEKGEDGVATITLNRPERLNAFNQQMIEDMRAPSRCSFLVSGPAGRAPVPHSVVAPVRTVVGQTQMRALRVTGAVC